MKDKITFIVVLTFLSMSIFAQQETMHSSFRNKLEKIKKSKLFSYEDVIALNESNAQKKSTLVTKQKLDSVIFQEWDEDYGQLEDYSKSVYTYNENGQPTVSTYYLWNNETDQWDIYSKQENSYDENWIKTQTINYTLNFDNELIPSDKNEFTYSIGLLKISTVSDYDEIADKWTFFAQSSYTYNANQNLSAINWSTWNEGTNTWIQYSKEEFTYVDNHNTIHQYSHWNGTTWDTISKYEYTYENENMTQSIYFNWVENWIPNDKKLYVYNGNNQLIEKNSYSWVDGWNESGQEIYVYAENGDLIELTDNYWDGSTNQWVSHYKSEFEYNTNFSYWDLIHPYEEEEVVLFFNHQLSNMKDLVWDEGSNSWKVEDQRNFHYSAIDFNSVSEQSNMEVCIYPNPSSDYIAFDIANNNSSFIVNLFDIQGHRLLSEELSNKENMSIESLNTGLYFYTILIEGEKIEGKLIKY